MTEPANRYQVAIPIRPDDPRADSVHHKSLQRDPLESYLSGYLTRAQIKALTGQDDPRAHAGVVIRHPGNVQLYDARRAHQDLSTAASFWSEQHAATWTACPPEDIDVDLMNLYISTALDCLDDDLEFNPEYAFHTLADLETQRKLQHFFVPQTDRYQEEPTFPVLVLFDQQGNVMPFDAAAQNHPPHDGQFHAHLTITEFRSITGAADPTPYFAYVFTTSESQQAITLQRAKQLTEQIAVVWTAQTGVPLHPRNLDDQPFHIRALPLRLATACLDNQFEIDPKSVEVLLSRMSPAQRQLYFDTSPLQPI